MKIKTLNWIAWVSCVLIIIVCISLVVLYISSCNSIPDPPDPEPCEISYLVTETEEGKVATVLKNNVEILQIEATNGEKGERGFQGIQGIRGPQGEQGIPGTDCVFPDTIYLKDLDSGISKWYAISIDLLPPEMPNPDTTYVVDVILEGDTWVYILKGDSLRIYWDYSYKDVNGQPLDTADVWFHIAYTMNGQTYSLKPYQNTIQELSLVMYGLPQGDIIPCVSAYIVKEEQRVYSTWARSIDYGWKVRGD